MGRTAPLRAAGRSEVAFRPVRNVTRPARPGTHTRLPRGSGQQKAFGPRDGGPGSPIRGLARTREWSTALDPGRPRNGYPLPALGTDPAGCGSGRGGAPIRPGARPRTDSPTPNARARTASSVAGLKNRVHKTQHHSTRHHTPGAKRVRARARGSGWAGRGAPRRRGAAAPRGWARETRLTIELASTRSSVRVPKTTIEICPGEPTIFYSFPFRWFIFYNYSVCVYVCVCVCG